MPKYYLFAGWMRGDHCWNLEFLLRPGEIVDRIHSGYFPLMQQPNTWLLQEPIFADDPGSKNSQIFMKVYPLLSSLVTLHLVREQTCSGDNLTFSCTETGTFPLVWILSGLHGFPGTSGAFGQTLNNDFVRITSPDATFGPNPSIITILNVTAADNGATVQCATPNVASKEITITIRE